MKRLVWIGLGVIVFLIVVLDNPWPSPKEHGRAPVGVEVSSVQVNHTQPAPTVAPPSSP